MMIDIILQVICRKKTPKCTDCPFRAKCKYNNSRYVSLSDTRDKRELIMKGDTEQ
jgi:adenine-specific DNA glycosylase